MTQIENAMLTGEQYEDVYTDIEDNQAELDKQYEHGKAFSLKFNSEIEDDIDGA